MSMPLKPDAEEDAERQERERQLAADLAVTDSWLDALKDPEYGAVGKKLKAAIAFSPLVEKSDMAMRLNAVFNSYAYPPHEGEKGYKPELIYGLPALNQITTLLGARCHEYIHALQYEKGAAIHASPFNEAAPFFLSPLDYMRLKEALEQDAYVKGAWLQVLAENLDKGMLEALGDVPLPADAFKKIRESGSSLQEAFTKAAKAASEAQGKWVGGHTGPARDLWHSNAIKEYAWAMGTRIRQGERNFKFARLEKKDFEEICTAFGLSTFDGNLQPVLSAANQGALEALNIILGIRPIPLADPLPTLSEALQEAGLLREEFMRKSKEYVRPPKKSPSKNSSLRP